MLKSLMNRNLIAQINIGQEYLFNGQGVKNVFPTVGSLFSVLLSNVYTIISIILVFVLIFGGITLIVGTKEGNKGTTSKGKAAITAAIAGFFIVVFSYFIIQLIETITGTQILNPKV